jgi:hypothetical protein
MSRRSSLRCSPPSCGVLPNISRSIPRSRERAWKGRIYRASPFGPNHAGMLARKADGQVQCQAAKYAAMR